MNSSKRAPEMGSWILPTLLAVSTAALYLIGLSINGYANSFYAAAAQAGADNWTAFFFGSSDMGNSITVDKTPLSLWPAALAIKLFGLSSWSLLVPQALMGVASVELLRRTVRNAMRATANDSAPAATPAETALADGCTAPEVSDSALGGYARWADVAGLVAGFTLAFTPVAALMFRFNNPDALLVLLMVSAFWSTTKALDEGKVRWIAAAGIFLGFGFLAKQLQVLLVAPAVFGTWLLSAPTSFGRRVAGALAGFSTMIVSAGWYIAAVESWPAEKRPWIGGSQNNSLLELTLGYNGVGRLNGNEVGSVGGGPTGAEVDAMYGGAAGAMNGGGDVGMGGSPFGDDAGIARLFGGALATQASWLLPLALVVLVAGLVLTVRRPRTDRMRSALLLWGGWTVVTALVFSLMEGIFHEYYTVALAPGVAALTGLGTALYLGNRDNLLVRIVAAVSVAGSAAWAARLIVQGEWWTPLAAAVGITGALGAIALVLPVGFLRRVPAVIAAGLIAFTLFASPVAYAVQTAATPHTGSIVTAGPMSRTGMGGPSGPGGPGGPGGDGPMDGRPAPPGADGTGGFNGDGRMGGPPAPPGADGADGADGTDGTDGAVNPPAQAPDNGVEDSAPAGPGGGMGGLLDAAKPSQELAATLTDDADEFTWMAATVGSQNASGYQLSTGYSVMPIGGFNGSDPAPTLEQFKAWVAEERIHWFIGGRGMGPGANTGHDVSGDITSWVAENFTAITVDGTTLYDLTAPVA